MTYPLTQQEVNLDNFLRDYRIIVIDKSAVSIFDKAITKLQDLGVKVNAADLFDEYVESAVDRAEKEVKSRIEYLQKSDPERYAELPELPTDLRGALRKIVVDNPLDYPY